MRTCASENAPCLVTRETVRRRELLREIPIIITLIRTTVHINRRQKPFIAVKHLRRLISPSFLSIWPCCIIAMHGGSASSLHQLTEIIHRSFKQIAYMTITNYFFVFDIRKFSRVCSFADYAARFIFLRQKGWASLWWDRWGEFSRLFRIR